MLLFAAVGGGEFESEDYPFFLFSPNSSSYFLDAVSRSILIVYQNRILIL